MKCKMNKEIFIFNINFKLKLVNPETSWIILKTRAKIITGDFLVYI